MCRLDRAIIIIFPKYELYWFRWSWWWFIGKIAVKRRWVHPISNKIPLDQAALIEPLSVGHHAFVRSGAKAGDIALVGGAGQLVYCFRQF